MDDHPSTLIARDLDINKRIRDDILEGYLPFGKRVTISELATRYGVSHLPVREALRELSGQGLIVIEKNRGASVRNIDINYVDNLFDIRTGLEVLIARRAARLRTDADVKVLASIESQLEDAVGRADYAMALDCNRQLHQRITQVAANPDAQMLLDQHWMLLSVLWRQRGFVPHRFAGVISDHQHILEAIREGDSEGAGVLMQAHVLKAKQTMLRTMRADST